MLKSVAGVFFASCLLISCAAPTQTAAPQASAGQAAATSSVDSQPSNNNQAYDTIWVPPPTGSLLGGGYVRVPKKVTGNDETALVGNINYLNAAAGAREERPFVVAAVSRVTGVSESELQAQQDVLRLRFGELCAINAIARGNSNKVQQIATLRAKGRSWTELASQNGLSIATVVETTRNASDLTNSSFSNSAERQKGGLRKMHETGVRDFPRPNDG